MSPRLTRRRTAIAVASAAAVIGATLFTGTATAASSAEPVSNPVPIVTPEGTVFSYVLNARHQNTGNTRLLEKAVVDAGGVVVQSWPQIGVVVAHSTKATFRADVVAAGGNQLESVGASRTVAVSEGTPTDLSTDPVKGYQPDAKVKANGDIASAPTPFTGTPDPREVEQWDMQIIKADQAH